MPVPGELGRGRAPGRSPRTRRSGANGMPRRSHQRIPDVVADPGERPVADQPAGAALLAGAADGREARMLGRQPHLGPDADRGPRDPVAAAHVVGVGTAVVEEVEPDQLDALVLEIDERAVEAALVRPEEPRPVAPSRGPGCRRPRSPSSSARRPTGRGAPRDRAGAAAAAGALLPDLAEEPAGAVLGDRADAAPHGFGRRPRDRPAHCRIRPR